MRHLRGRTVVVTGAARGPGAALAQAFDDRGARLALLGLEGERLQEVAASLHDEVAWWEVDVTDAQPWPTQPEWSARLGPASVVMGNAGVAEGGPFADSDPHWRRVIEVDLTGALGLFRMRDDSAQAG
ncbi:SDR family NAD(P)-dependent oxidoreductase [Streptomyces sp. NPDC090036]|uniref:SDR family NAD(P)-dependent oxidoreductase n=1 Tax=Streptomyces sp. NPDC090036 TaxID=3365926 RepID=UPI00380EFCA8